MDILKVDVGLFHAWRPLTLVEDDAKQQTTWATTKTVTALAVEAKRNRRPCPVTFHAPDVVTSGRTRTTLKRALALSATITITTPSWWSSSSRR